MTELWVFGYGSLLWDPGFPVSERRVARLDGWARGFCMRSIHHRGTEREPGLVLALDEREGACCRGMALRAESGQEDSTLEYLRRRELVSAAYLERRLPVTCEDGSAVEALTFVIDREHPQYCGELPFEEQARIIARARGGRGPNRDYLFNTVAHLEGAGLPDRGLELLRDRVLALDPQSPVA